MSGQVDLRAIRSVANRAEEAEQRARLAEQRELAVHALNDRLRKTIQALGDDLMNFIKAAWPKLDRELAEVAAKMWAQGTNGKALPGPMPPGPAETPAKQGDDEGQMDAAVDRLVEALREP